MRVLKLRRFIAFFMAIALMFNMNLMNCTKVYAAEFNLHFENFNSADVTGSAKWKYNLGDKIVFCINNGHNVDQNDGYNKYDTWNYKSKGKSDMTRAGAIAKLALYWTKSNKSDKIRSRVQAIIWAIYNSKDKTDVTDEVQAVIGSGTTYKEIFDIDGKIKSVETVYQSEKKKSNQKMMDLYADKIEGEKASVDIETFKASLTYYQKLKLRKVDQDGKAIPNFVFQITLADFGHAIDNDRNCMGFKNLEEIEVNNGTWLVPTYDSNGRLTKLTQEVATNQGGAIRNSFERDEVSTNGSNRIIYVKTDSNGYIQLRFKFSVDSKEYAWGKYKLSGDSSWTELVKYSDYEKTLTKYAYKDSNGKLVQCESSDSGAHTMWYWIKQAFDDENSEATLVRTKNIAYSKARGTWSRDNEGNLLNGTNGTRSDISKIWCDTGLLNNPNFYGIKEVENASGNAWIFGQESSNTLSRNSGLDGYCRWVKIYRDKTEVSNVDNLTATDSYTYNGWTNAGTYVNETGGTYTSSKYVDKTANGNNKYIASSSSSTDELSAKGFVLTPTSRFGINKNGNLIVATAKGSADPTIVDAYYSYGTGKLSANRVVSEEFVIKKTDEDGKILPNTEFKLSLNMGEYKNNVDSVVANGKKITTDEFNVKTDEEGLIKIKVSFKKEVSGNYIYGKYFDYGTGTYKNVENASVYNSLSYAYKVGIKQVVENANTSLKYHYSTTYDIENGKKAVDNDLKNQLDKWENDFNKNKNLKFVITEIDTESDYYTIDEAYAKGVEFSITNGKKILLLNEKEVEVEDEILVIDKYKYVQPTLIKKNQDTNEAIKGAVFGIYEDEEGKIPASMYDENGNLVNKLDDSGKVKEVLYTTDKEGKINFDYVRCSDKKTYYVREIKAPEGFFSIYEDYITDNDILSFKADGKDIDDLNVLSANYIKFDVTNKEKPYLKTTLLDTVTNSHVASSEGKIKLEDTVKYKNLKPNTEYTVTGVLMDKSDETGNTKILDKDGNEITAQTTFKTDDSGDGTVVVTFEFELPDNIEGLTAVAFEDIKDVCTHADIKDEEQTVHFPKIHTTAVSGETKEHTGFITDNMITIIDTVTYENLIPNKKYTLTGYLVDSNTGSYLYDDKGKIKKTVNFISTEANGSEEVVFTFKKDKIYTEDKKAFDLNGSSIVVFEYLTDTNNHRVSKHEDKDDEDQTVNYPKANTTATDKLDGDKKVSGDIATIVDNVRFENLTPGRKYTVTGVLMDKKTGKELMVDGKKVTGSTTFTCKKENDVVDVEFKFNISNVNVGDYVIFEEVIDYKTKAKVVEHKDITSVSQTITVERPPHYIPPQTGDTSKIPVMMEIMLLSLLGLISMILLKKKYNKKFN